MSEQIPDDEMPAMRLDFDGEEFLATPENTFFCRYIGKTVIDGEETNNNLYDHIRLKEEDEETGEVENTCVFEFESAYQGMSRYMKKARFPQVINLWKVPEPVIGARQKAIDNIIAAEEGADTLADWPEDWPQD